MVRQKKKRKKKKKKSYLCFKIFLALILSLTIVMTFYLVIRDGGESKPIPQYIIERYPVKGVDVSRHNGVIDWEKLREQSIQFAYIKATEGTSYIDTTFNRNYKAAKAAGLLVGAYHFFRFNQDGEAQALHFIKNMTFEKGDLPPMIDVEKSTLNPFKSTKKVVLRLRDLIHRLHVHCYTRPIIYTNKNCYNKYIKNYFPNRRLWISDLSGEPDSTIYYKWIFWQYSHKGCLEGVKEKIDLDVFRSSLQELKELSSY